LKIEGLHGTPRKGSRTGGTIDPLALGGTLFIPANHKNLPAVLKRDKYPTLRSCVIDTEDGLHVKRPEDVLPQLCELLETHEPNSLYVFLRPRNIEWLETMLTCKALKRIDGFVLPKFSLENADAYFQTLDGFDGAFMPSVEGRELFDATLLRALKEKLSPYKARIPLVRFGAEDMLRQLGMRRERAFSLYELSATSQVIANMLHIFKPDGYEVCAPVYPFYNDAEGFEKELRRDLAEGLLGKTIIHPSQIEAFERVYRVDSKTYESARNIASFEGAVFGDGGEMAEKATRQPWAEKILRRVEIFGVGGNDVYM